MTKAIVAVTEANVTMTKVIVTLTKANVLFTKAIVRPRFANVSPREAYVSPRDAYVSPRLRSSLQGRKPSRRKLTELVNQAKVLEHVPKYLSSDGKIGKRYVLHYDDGLGFSIL